LLVRMSIASPGVLSRYGTAATTAKKAAQLVAARLFSALR
jgi:hypothetical protein